MYINKPTATKIEAADRVNLLHGTELQGLNSGNHEKLVRCLFPCPDGIHHFMTVTKTNLAFRHTN